MHIGLIRDPLNWPYLPVAREMLSAAVALSDEHWDQVDADLADEKARLGVVIDDGVLLAAMILRTVDSKAGPVVEMSYIGGHDHRRWTKQLSDMLLEGARAEGCVGLRAWGRPGWGPILKAAGWKAPVIGFEMAV